MPETSVIEVNLSAIHRNLGVLRRAVAPEVEICCIVKADAYGLGAIRLAKRLLASGADMLAVYTIDQAAAIVTAMPSIPALVLMPVHDLEPTGDVYRAVVAGRVHLSVHGLDHLDHLVNAARQFGCVIPVHLEVDTGMNRGGASLAEAQTTLHKIVQHPRLRLTGLYTHFTSAERDPEETTRQMNCFDEFVEENQSLIPHSCRIHAANTAAAMRGSSFHKQMIRVGMAWIGYAGELVERGTPIDIARELMPAVTWSSEIVHVKNISEGDRVGYGGTWRSARQSRIALVPVGYADGYPVTCGSGHTIHQPTSVGVCTNREAQETFFAPVVGAVNMDQITIDVTDLPDMVARTGARVEIYSPDREAPNHVPTIARQIGSPPHELLSRLNGRIRRAYCVRPVENGVMASISEPGALVG